MNMIDIYKARGQELRLAFHRFMQLKGLQLATICETINKPGFGYKAVVKWLPTRVETITDPGFKPEVSGIKQLTHLANCISTCLKAYNFILVNDKGEPDAIITGPEQIPFYDPEKKELRVKVITAQSAPAPLGPAAPLTLRIKYEQANRDRVKLLMIQAGVAKGIRKSYLYLKERDQSMDLFFEDNENARVTGNYSGELSDVMIINSMRTNINTLRVGNDYCWQIIFQGSGSDKNLFEGVYSAYDASLGYPTCGKVFLVRAEAGMPDDATLLAKAYEYLLFDTKRELKRDTAPKAVVNERPDNALSLF